jgi:hypothetical protein
MESLFQDPAVQGGIAPFFAGLIVAAVLGRVRLGGLAVAAGYVVAIVLVTGIAFTPLTALRKVVLIALAAPVLGIAMDFVLRGGRVLETVVAVACGALVVWVFWSVLQHKKPGEAALLGGVVAIFAAWLVAATMTLAREPVRAGAAALVLGLGIGISAILSASALLGLYGIGLAAGAGGFLLWQMVTGRSIAAGATLTLPASVAAALFAAAAVLLAKLPWYVLIVFALTPLAARLPVPARFPIWAQAILLSVYSSVIAFAAIVLTWRAHAPPG